MKDDLQNWQMVAQKLPTLQDGRMPEEKEPTHLQTSVHWNLLQPLSLILQPISLDIAMAGRSGKF